MEEIVQKKKALEKSLQEELCKTKQLDTQLHQSLKESERKEEELIKKCKGNIMKNLGKLSLCEY